MPFITVKDQTSIFYRDWGSGQPVVFCAGWALSSQMWRSQMLALTEAGMRCVAYDRRGHGRSDDPGRGYDFDTLADDLDGLLSTLDLDGACLVAHSMAGGEVIRYLSRHGSARVCRVVLLSSVAPVLVASDSNPGGLGSGVVEMVRSAWRADFGHWIEDSAAAYFATGLPGNVVSAETVSWTMRDMQETSFQAVFDCNKAMTDADWRCEMREIAVPVLLIHGDSDASIPLETSSRLTAALIPHGQLKVYENAGHGLYVTHKDRLARDLLSFISSQD